MRKRRDGANCWATEKVSALKSEPDELLPGRNRRYDRAGQSTTSSPETADELREVAKQLGADPEDIKLGKAATVTDVKHERLHDYRVVYFATHALVAGEIEKFAKVNVSPHWYCLFPPILRKRIQRASDCERGCDAEIECRLRCAFGM